MNLVADVRDFAQLADLWQRAPDLTRRELLAAVTDADLLLQGEIQQRLPAGASGGAGGLRSAVGREEQALADNVLGSVFSDRPYAPYVELGTGPHRPPIQPLVDWVEAKLGEAGSAARGIAFGIANAIAARGTRPNPVWVPTFTRLQPEILRKVQAAAMRIAQQLLGGAR